MTNLNINDHVYCVCRIPSDKDGGAAYTYYVAEKQVNRITLDLKTNEILYTAGLHRELKFRETSDGQFESTGNFVKPVFLCRSDAGSYCAYSAEHQL